MVKKVNKSICIDKECEDRLRELGGSAWINQKILEEREKTNIDLSIDPFWDEIDKEISSLEEQLNGIDDFKTLTKINALKRKKEINGRL
jgi:hypothetical protein